MMETNEQLVQYSFRKSKNNVLIWVNSYDLQPDCKRNSRVT